MQNIQICVERWNKNLNISHSNYNNLLHMCIYVHRCVWKLYDWVHYLCSNHCPPPLHQHKIHLVPVERTSVVAIHNQCQNSLLRCAVRLWFSTFSALEDCVVLVWSEILVPQKGKIFFDQNTFISAIHSWLSFTLPPSISLWIWSNHQNLSEVATSSNKKIFPKSRL